MTLSELSATDSHSKFDSVSSLSIADLHDMVNQVHLLSSSASNIVLSMISGTSLTWLLNSACYNRMTSSPDVVPYHTSTSLPTIYTTNGSPMHVSHLGNVSTPALSVSNVYQIPKLTHNLFSIGQLTELGFYLTFSSIGVVVQDSMTRQIVGTARKVRRLFELIFLHLPSSRLSASAVSGQSTSSLDLWHSCLGHASISRVKQLVSRGLLGSISNKSFDCMPCQFGKQTDLPFNNRFLMLFLLLILFILMYGGPLPFLLRVGHVTLLFLWMIFPYILGFASSKIVLNFIKYILTLPK